MHSRASRQERKVSFKKTIHMTHVRSLTTWSRKHRKKMEKDGVFAEVICENRSMKRFERNGCFLNGSVSELAIPDSFT